MTRCSRILAVLLLALLVVGGNACSSDAASDVVQGGDVIADDTGGIQFTPGDAKTGDPDSTVADPDVPQSDPDTTVADPDVPQTQPDVPVEPDCTIDDDCPDGQICQGGVCVTDTGEVCPDGVCPTDAGALMEITPAGDIDFSYMPGVAIAIERNVMLASTGDGPLVIYAISLGSGTPQDFSLANLPTLPATLHPGDLATFDVVFEEVSAAPGEGTIQILCNVVGASRRIISLVPQAKGAAEQPCIVVSPSSLDFGTVQRGQIVSRDVTITNCSSSLMLPLTVTEVERGTGFFGGLSQEFQIGSPANVPATIPRGQSVTQSFTFAAGLAGTKTGYFTIHNNDPDQEEVRLDVRGVSEPPPLESQGIHVQLDWDSDNCDVDLHLIAPGGSFNDRSLDCYYANMQPDWGTSGDYLDNPFLDQDNVWGYGPENINLQEPTAGTYRVIIHYYLDNYNGSSSVSTNATVNVFSYGNLLGTYGPTFLEGTDKMWDVVDITWSPSTGASVTPLGTVYDR